MIAFPTPEVPGSTAGPRAFFCAFVELARDWRTDKYLRRLEAIMVAVDDELMYLISGNGDVIEPDAGIVAIGSGGVAAQALASLHTVTAYGGQRVEVQHYSSYLGNAEAAGVRKGASAGLMMGVMYAVMFFAYGVGLWFGGTLVIEQTEALVTIDVNSGKSTGEKSIEQTAYQTNLEAAEESARQLRLRDLGGLIVIDFIDMRDPKHRAAVERTLKQHVKEECSLHQYSSFNFQNRILQTHRQYIRIRHSSLLYRSGIGLQCEN